MGPRIFRAPGHVLWGGIMQTRIWRFLSFLFFVPFLLLCFKSSSCRAGALFPEKFVTFNVFAAAAISPERSVFVGQEGKILLSTHGGQNLRAIGSGTSNPLFSVKFIKAGWGWISGTSGTILHSKDGGETWYSQNSGIDKHLFSIDFYDQNHGCAVGDWGKIVMTSDGGDSWRQTSLEEDVVLYGVVQLSAQNACAVGEMGRIFSTRDKGVSWQEINSPVGSTLFCLDHDGPFLCAAGLDGAIICSMDGGANWQKFLTGDTRSIYGISICGQRTWAVGDAGKVLLSRDRGITWESIDDSKDLLPFWLSGVSCMDSGTDTSFGVMGGAKGITAQLENSIVHWRKPLGNGGKELQ